MKNMFCLLIVLILVSCTNESASRNALESQGFTNISFQGPAIFGCNNNDETATSFTATNSQGRRVSGVACCPLIETPFAKGCTIRW